MKLFLAAQSYHPESMAKLATFVDKPLKEHSIADMPTASNGLAPGGWRTGNSYQTTKEIGSDLTVVELETMSRNEITRNLLQAEIIWVAGGQPGYLLYWMRRHHVDTLLVDLFQNDKEKLYVGSSAGSMVASEKQTLAQWEINGEVPERDVVPGLGLIHF